jgi:hypothetical protein
LAVTDTAPPAAPLFDAGLEADDDGLADEGAEDGLDAGEDGLDAGEDAAKLGTAVAPAPSTISTCPAATEELAVAVTPKAAAMFAAFAAFDDPAPYRTSVADCEVALPTWPAW